MKLVASPKLTLNSCELANSLFIWKILGLQKITQFCATIHHMINYDWWRCVSTWPTYTCHNSPCDELWHKIVPFFLVVAQFDLYLLSSQSSVLTVSLFHEQHSCMTRKVSISPPSLSLSLSYALPICFAVVSSIQEIKWPVYICDSKLFLARQPVATQFCLGCSYFTLKKFRVI